MTLSEVHFNKRTHFRVKKCQHYPIILPTQKKPFRVFFFDKENNTLVNKRKKRGFGKSFQRLEHEKKSKHFFFKSFLIPNAPDMYAQLNPP